MEWQPIGESRPPEGWLVETKIDEPVYGVRNVQLMRRSGDLWFIDLSGGREMYVYYRPTHWRYKQDPCTECGDRCGSQLEDMTDDQPHALCSGCDAKLHPEEHSW